MSKHQPKYVPRVAEYLQLMLARMTGDALGTYSDPLKSLSEDIAVARTVVDRCESPIEQLVAIALLTRWEPDAHFTHEYPWAHIVAKRWDATNKAIVTARQQVTLGTETDKGPPNIRLDFLIEPASGPSDWRLAIECDGHNFHERTPEQAERDRSRDRELTAHGFVVMRFTGREIVRSPYAIVDDIDRVIATLLAKDASR